MIRICTLAGLIGLMLPGIGLTIDSPVYQHAKTQTELELNLAKTEMEVERFTIRLMNEREDIKLLNLKAIEIDMAVENKYKDLCAKREVDDKELLLSECAKLARDIPITVTRSTQDRIFARDLQTIATSYEVGTDGYTGRIHKISTGLPSIISIWESGVDKFTNPVQKTRIRSGTLPDDSVMNPLYNQLVTELEKLIDKSETGKHGVDNLVAAVWRYRHGFWPMKENETCHETGDGSELEKLSMRWCGVEDALEKIWEKVPKEFNPELAPGEIAYFPPKKKTVAGIEIIIWMRADDAGIIWDIPLEPVFPSTISANDELVLGGEYPDPPKEPESDEGICSHPFARRGYLCRPVLDDTCPTGKEVEAKGDKMINLSLTGCEQPRLKTEIRTTEAGPDICRTGGWKTPINEDEFKKDTPKKNPDLRPGECSNCVVDLYCGNCGDLSGITYAKNENGVIEICIGPNSVIDTKYVVIHEMVHAQQYCDQPFEPIHPPNTREECCAAEYYPYLVSCKAMAEDGVFDETKYSIEECATMMSDGSCTMVKNACSGLPDNDVRRNEFLKTIKSENPEKCEHAVNFDTIDSRVLEIKESLNSSCNPKCESEYVNTIGNNLCYIGQCIEESLEAHRLIPGRMPLVTQDEAFPWDSCSAEDPNNASVLFVPPFSSPEIPPYKGQHVIENLDSLLCQINGFPRLSPPVLCNFDPRRSFALPSESFLKMFYGLVGQESAQDTHVSDLQSSLENISARMGATLFVEYLKPALKGFGEILGTVSTLTKQIGETKFPVQMCPRYYTDDCSIFEPPAEK